MLNNYFCSTKNFFYFSLFFYIFQSTLLETPCFASVSTQLCVELFDFSNNLSSQIFNQDNKISSQTSKELLEKRLQLRKQAQRIILEILVPHYDSLFLHTQMFPTIDASTKAEISFQVIKILELLSKEQSRQSILHYFNTPPSPLWISLALTKPLPHDPQTPIDTTEDLESNPQNVKLIAFQSLDNILNLTPYSEKVQWPLLLYALLSFGNIYDEQQLTQFSLILSKELIEDNTIWSVNAGYDLYSKISANDLVKDFRELLRETPNYKLFRKVLVTSGQLKIFESIIEGSLPELINEIKQLPSSMSDKGQPPTFSNLKDGIQINGAFNPFAKYIGISIKNIPLLQIEKQLSRINNFIPQIHKTPSISQLRVFHRTDSPFKAQQIANGQAIISLGKDSAFGGSAVWGEGTYLGFSNDLFQYGPFLVELQLNPDAVIGKDLDIFVGKKDGYIIVAKNVHAFQSGSGKFNPLLEPKLQEPASNHLLWLAHQIKSLSKSSKDSYIQKILNSVTQLSDWGPFQLLTLAHLESQNESRINLISQINTILENHPNIITNSKLTSNPFYLLQQIENFIHPDINAYYKFLAQNNSVIRQFESSPILLTKLDWAPLPETMLSKLISIYNNKEQHYSLYNIQGDLDANNNLPDYIKNTFKQKTKARIREAFNFLDSYDYSTLSDLRFLVTAYHLWNLKNEFQKFDSENNIQPKDPLKISYLITKQLNRMNDRLLSYNEIALQKDPVLKNLVKFIIDYKTSEFLTLLNF